jgi:hypothetical protein
METPVTEFLASITPSSGKFVAEWFIQVRHGAEITCGPRSKLPCSTQAGAVNWVKRKAREGGFDRLRVGGTIVQA